MNSASCGLTRLKYPTFFSCVRLSNAFRRLGLLRFRSSMILNVISLSSPFFDPVTPLGQRTRRGPGYCWGGSGSLSSAGVLPRSFQSRAGRVTSLWGVRKVASGNQHARMPGHNAHRVQRKTRDMVRAGGHSQDDALLIAALYSPATCACLLHNGRSDSPPSASILEVAYSRDQVNLP